MCRSRGKTTILQTRPRDKRCTHTHTHTFSELSWSCLGFHNRNIYTPFLLRPQIYGVRFQNLTPLGAHKKTLRSIHPPYTHTNTHTMLPGKVGVLECIHSQGGIWVELSYLRMRKTERTGSCSFAERKARRRTEAWTLPSYPFSSPNSLLFCVSSKVLCFSLPHHILGNRKGKQPHPNPSQMQRDRPTKWIERKEKERETMTQGQDGKMILVDLNSSYFESKAVGRVIRLGFNLGKLVPPRQQILSNCDADSLNPHKPNHNPASQQPNYKFASCAWKPDLPVYSQQTTTCARKVHYTTPPLVRQLYNSLQHSCRFNQNEEK